MSADMAFREVRKRLKTYDLGLHHGFRRVPSGEELIMETISLDAENLAEMRGIEVEDVVAKMLRKRFGKALV